MEHIESYDSMLHSDDFQILLLCMGNFLKTAELVIALFLLSGCHILILFYCC